MIVPKNLPAANAVTICAAPPALTSKVRANTGMIGNTIAHAPEKNVPAYNALRPRTTGLEKIGPMMFKRPYGKFVWY